MLKRMLPLLLALVLCAAAAIAEGDPTLVITEEMEFYAGPGTACLQSAFHNTPPKPGETAVILGRVAGADGQDWLFVRFTGHWFSQEYPVQYYLPVSAAPEHADAPLLSFLSEPNALGAETVRVYADPDGTNADGYLTPNDAGVIVLAVEGSFAYVEAVNPYGLLRRGYISTDDLTAPPGMTGLSVAPAGVAALVDVHALPLSCQPANSYVQVLALSDRSLVLQYDSIPANAPWGEAIAVVSSEGHLLANHIYRTHDGMEESTLEFLLSSGEGFRICRYVGDDLTTIHESHYTAAGEALHTDVRRYADSAPRPLLGTAGFTVSLGRAAYAELNGSSAISLRITTVSGTSTQRNIGLYDSVPAIAGCAGMLIVPVCTETGTRLLVFGGDAALLCEAALPADMTVYAMQAAPMADGRIALMFSTAVESWQCFWLDASAGVLSPGPAVAVPYNRRVSLLAADGQQLLIAVSGVDTQLLLTDGATPQLAAALPGTVLHAQSDGDCAALLIIQDGALRLERWTLQLP